MLKGAQQMIKTTLSSIALLAAIISSCAPSEGDTKLRFSDEAIETRALMFEHVSSLREDPTNPNALGWWNQMTAAAGREDLLADLQGIYDDPSGTVCSDLRGTNAIDAIANVASEYSVVIINEHHAMPSHRAFIRDVLVRLRAEGFTHYAAETLSPQGALNTEYTTTGDGWYTTEPLMARLLNDVRNLGYTQIAYEQTAEQRAPEDADTQTQIETRENAQVTNLQTAIFDKAPDTKIVIHVGHSHVAEKPVHGTEWMAARLKKAIGLDPITISLTACSSDSAQTILGTAAISSDGESKTIFTDYVVGLPQTNFQNNRPSYRAHIGDKAVPVPTSMLPKSQALMIEARPVGAELDQEPVERLYLAPDENIPLMLPVGKWSLISFGEDGEILSSEEVSVGE